MPRTPRSSRPSPRTLAVVNQAQLEQYASQPSELEQLLQTRRATPTQRQAKIADDLYTAAGVIAGHHHLHELANDTLLRMHLHATQTFFQGARSLNATAHQASFLDEETARDVADWVKADKELLRRHLAGNLDGAASIVIGLAHRELYREEEERKRPKGILGWLLGMGDGDS